MKKMKMNLRLIVGFSLILILCCALIMSGMLAKYRTDVIIANEVDYTNQLAESFKLLDKPVVQQEDGSYKVSEEDDAEPTDGFSYKLIPGITLPAAPYIEIVNKTAIPAYLYLEIDNSGPVELLMDSSWQLLDGVTGKKGGKVYSYGDDALVGAAQTDATEQESGTEEQEQDDVLTFPTFTVKTLDKVPVSDEGAVKVYAYLIQKVEDTNVRDAYQNAPAP